MTLWANFEWDRHRGGSGQKNGNHTFLRTVTHFDHTFSRDSGVKT